MPLRSSVESTRPLTGTSPITKWKRLRALAGFALLALIMAAVPAVASAGLSSINIISGNNQTGPTNTVLPDPLTVQYLDSAGSPIPGGSLIYTVTSGDAVLDVQGGVTQAFVSADAVGRAAVPVRFGSTPGPVRVEVTDFFSTPPAIFNLTALAPTNSITVVSGDGQQANVGQPFASPIVAELRDGQGMLPDGVPVTFQITEGVATFSNGQFSIVSNTVGGRAQASLIAGDEQGGVTIRISATGYTDAFASAFVNSVGNPYIFILSGGFQQTTVNTPFPMPLVARVDDGLTPAPGRNGGNGARNPVPNVPVTFTVQTGNALFSNGQSSIVVNSDTNGEAAVFIDATSPEGEVIINVTTAAFGSTQARLDIIGGSGFILAQQGDFQDLFPGDSTPIPLIAQVQNAAEQPVPGVTVTYRVRDTGLTPPLGITFTPSSDVSDAMGNVTFVVNTTSKTPNGEFEIEASAPGYSPAVFRLTVSDKAGSISFDITGGNNQSGPTGQALPALFQVQAINSGDGIIPIENLVVTYTVTSGSASIADAGGNPQQTVQVLTDANGIAGVLVTPLNPGGAFTVTASANISGTDYTEVFNGNGVGMPNTLTIVGGDAQSGPPNTTAPLPVIAEFRDGAGNPVPGVQLKVEITSGNALVQDGTNPPSTFFVTSTDSYGQVRANLLFGATPGAVTGRVGELPPAPSDATQSTGLIAPFTATITGGAPTLTITGGNNQSAPPNTTLPDPLTARLLDGAGNPISGTSVLYTVTSGNATFSNGQTTFATSTDAAGNMSATLVLGPTPGQVTVDVDAGGVIATFNEMIVLGATPPSITYDPPASSSFTLSPDGSTAFGSISATPMGGSGSGPGATTTVDNCNFATNPGSFTVSGQPLTFVGNTTQPQTLFLTCQVGPNAVTARLTCSEVRGATTPIPVVFDVTCPAAPSSPTITIVSGNNQAGNPGTNSAPLRVQLSPAPYSAPVTFSLLSGSGSLLDANGNPATQVIVNSDPDGTASVVFRYGNTPGPVQIQAAAVGFGSVVFDLTVVPVAQNDTFRIVSGNNQTGAPGTRSQALVVELLRDGTPSSGETINWFVRFGDAQVENFATTTGADGRSSNFITFGQTLGPIVIEARTGDGQLAVQFNLTTAPASAITIRLVSGGCQSGLINSPFAAPLVFEVANTQGQVQGGVLVAFAVIQGSATLDANSAITDAAGRVSVTGRYGPNAGAIQVRATIGSDANLSSAIADLTALAPGLRIVSGDNQSALVGTALPAPLVVEVTRPTGSSGSLAGIVLRWTVIEGGGTVSSATTTTDAAGRASNALTLGAQAGSNRVRVDADGGGTVTFVATATAAPPPSPSPVRLEIVSGNNQNLATNTDSAPLVVRVVDSATGAPRSNICVAFAAVTPGVTLSFTQVGSDINGLARVIARLGDVGPAVVSARVCDSAVGQVNFALNGALVNTLGLDPDDRGFGIAQAFDNACPALRSLRASGATLSAGQADLLARCDDLEFNAGNDPDRVIDALEEILSDEAEAQNTAALTIAAAQFDNLKARIAALRSGTNGASFGGLALQGGNGAVPLSFASTALNATDEQPAPAEAGVDFDRWGFFATGTIGEGDRDPGGGSSGFDFETRGLTAGVDYRYTDSLIFGAALGYASNDVDIGSDAGALETKGWSISGYSTFYKGDSWYADGVLTYGSNQYDITRNVQFTLSTPIGTATAVDQVNTASPDGKQFSAAFTAGRDFQRGAWGFGPFLRWQYTKVDFDGYTETVSNPGAPGSGLTVAVDAREVKSMQGVLGGKATYTMSTAWGILIPHFQFEYVREFKDNPDDLVSRLVFDPTGTQIVVASSDIDQSFMNLGLGVSAVFANGRSAFMFYEKLLGQQGTSKDSIAIGIRIEF